MPAVYLSQVAPHRAEGFVQMDPRESPLRSASRFLHVSKRFRTAQFHTRALARCAYVVLRAPVVSSSFLRNRATVLYHSSVGILPPSCYTTRLSASHARLDRQNETSNCVNICKTALLSLSLFEHIPSRSIVVWERSDDHRARKYDSQGCFSGSNNLATRTQPVRLMLFRALRVQST